MNSDPAAVTEFTVFETALGWMGAAWRGRALVAFQLAAASRDATERGLRRRLLLPDIETPETPLWIAALVQTVQRYALGERVDFSGVTVDLSGLDPLRRAIYEDIRTLGFGETTTYGGLAAKLGRPGAAREVGQAMGANPVPLIVPCHRVLAAGNRLGGFSAPGGADSKLRMLMLEGVRLGPVVEGQASFGF